MNCDEVRDNLEWLVMGGLGDEDASRTRAHLARCEACAAVERDYRHLVGRIRRDGCATVARPAAERAIRLAIDAEIAEIAAARSRPRGVRVLWAVASVAAVLLIALVIWRPWRDEPPTAPAPAGLSWAPLPTASAGRLSTVAERWRYAGARTQTTSIADGVVVRGERMYLLCNDPRGARVVAVDAATGVQRWRSAVASLGYLAADRAHVFCLAADRRRVELVASAAGDGSVIWRYPQDRPGLLGGMCRPVVVTGERVCWTNGPAVHMLTAATGRELWTWAPPDEGPPSSAVVNGDDLLVATRSAVHCLSVRTGREKWRQPLPRDAPGRGPPLLAAGAGKAYIVRGRRACRGRLVTMDLATRAVLWRRNIPVVRSLLATDEGLYLRGREIVGLDHQTGRQRWACEAGGCGPLTLIDGRIHFVDTRRCGRLVAIEPLTGRKAWEITGIRSCDAFARVGRTGYIKTRDGVVHAIALGDARQL